MILSYVRGFERISDENVMQLKTCRLRYVRSLELSLSYLGPIFVQPRCDSTSGGYPINMFGLDTDSLGLTT